MTDRDQQIRARAYAKWQAEGGEHGRDRDHWADAEREFDAELTSDDPVSAEIAPELTAPMPEPESAPSAKPGRKRKSK